MLINSLNVHKNKCIYIPTHLCIHRCLSNSWQVLDVTGKMTIWRKPCSIKHKHGQSKLCFPLPPGSLYPQSESLESSFHGSSENFLLKKLLFEKITHWKNYFLNLVLCSTGRNAALEAWILCGFCKCLQSHGYLTGSIDLQKQNISRSDIILFLCTQNPSDF